MTEFLKHGFRLEKGIVLTAERVHQPQKFHPSVVVRPLETDQEWEDSVPIQVACGNDSLSKEQWEGFARSQLGRYRKMVRAGLGAWFGAYLGEKQVGSLGIFTDGDIGRFQIVSVHPDYQRRGICGAMVFKTASHAFERMGVRTLVMVADEEYHAAKIYESVGFAPTEKIVGVCWWDKSR